MSDVVLSAGVRQNLLSLQSTADLMSLTQNRLATGKKVNSALDNPGNFFTSQSLNNRASDLNALLDSIGQAQKTIEAADQGITSLTKLVESAKSVAKQALQAPQPALGHLLGGRALRGNPTDETLGYDRRRHVAHGRERRRPIRSTIDVNGTGAIDRQLHAPTPSATYDEILAGLQAASRPRCAAGIDRASSTLVTNGAGTAFAINAVDCRLRLHDHRARHHRSRRRHLHLDQPARQHRRGRQHADHRGQWRRQPGHHLRYRRRAKCPRSPS